MQGAPFVNLASPPSPLVLEAGVPKTFASPQFDPLD